MTHGGGAGRVAAKKSQRSAFDSGGFGYHGRPVRMLLLSLSLLAGCAARHPRPAAPSPGELTASAPATTLPSTSGPGPSIDERLAAFWVWHDGEVWRVRTTSGSRAHRFQGSVEGTSGGILEVKSDDPRLADHVAQVGNTVQFDYDSGDPAPHGFDARITGGCLRFDLLLDGKRRPERVHFGRGAEQPPRLPVERCP